MVQRENNQSFYGDQIFQLENVETIGYSNHGKNLILDDINNDGKEDVILLGRTGFEIFYKK